MLYLIWFSLRYTQDVEQKGIPINEESVHFFKILSAIPKYCEGAHLFSL